MDRDQLTDLNRELVTFISRVVPSVDDIMSHKVVLDLVRDVARRVLDPSADIQMFGSAASGLCERGSDIDATVIVDFAILNKRFHGKNRTPSVGHETRLLCSEAVCAIAKYIENSNGTGLAVEGLINGAKVPIVVLSSFGRQIIDVSINNVLPTYNTQLLGEYSKLDNRVVGLVLCVKRWAKMTMVSDAKMGNLSSYSWSLLCLYYLQYVGVIPSLQSRSPPGVHLYHCPSSGKRFDVGFLSGHFAQVEKQMMTASGSGDCLLSLAELLCGFFKFYDEEFNWGKEVVSIRIGGQARREINEAEFALLSQGSRTMMELPPGVEKIHIEDPFDLTRNLHCVMDLEGLIRLRKAFRDISKKLSNASIGIIASLAKTLMSYKNVVPAFSATELNKRYGTSGQTVAPSATAQSTTGTPSTNTSNNQSPLIAGNSNGGVLVGGGFGGSGGGGVQEQLDQERAAAIVRNYAKQQEILERQLLNLQARGNGLSGGNNTGVGVGGVGLIPTPQPAIGSGAVSNSTANMIQSKLVSTFGGYGTRASATRGLAAKQMGQPGRGSYKQTTIGGTWGTVDLW